MLVLGDLGFLGLFLVFFIFFFFGPIISFLIQKKWRIAIAKKEEIMRLVAMASEEAARVEFEATNVVYDDVVSVLRPFKCAVCHCPTTTRCSRCKVVRYCSGKCQIIHWRRGHKEDCHTPNTTTQLNGPGSDSDQDILLQGEQHEFYCKDLEMEGPWYTKPFETISKKYASSKSNLVPKSTSGREDDEVEDLVDARGAYIISELSSPLIHSTSTTSNASSNASVGVVPIPTSLSRSEGILSDDVASDVVETTIDVNEANLPPTEFTGSVNYVNISFSTKLRPKTRSCSSGVLHCESTSSSSSNVNGFDDCTVSEPSTRPSNVLEATLNKSSSRNDVGGNATMFNERGDGILSDSESILRSSNFKPKILECDDAYRKSFGKKRPSDRVTPSEKMDRNTSTVLIPPAMPSRLSAFVDNDQGSDSQPLESKGKRSTSERHPCSSTRRHSVSSVKLLKVDTVPIMPTGLSETANSLPNASNGLKTSVRKVVQQFRVPSLSKHNPFGIGSEVTERKNYKMLFPYGLFIKLYNWGKVELRPCGLTNYGNSCYANAVLQCLAFTQPLTAYLLQGLHSKACPKKEWCFTCEFECLILKASEGNSPLSPVSILSQLHSIGSPLGHGKEEDAHEFLRYAIDTMQSVCLKEAGVNAPSPLAEETTLVGLIFGGYLRSKIKCMKCHGKSERHERMMDLTVEIQGDIETLEEALGKFTATEILDGENKYQCSRCKSYEKAKKKLTVLEAPNVLTIAFKRFQSGKFGKLNKSIRFPEILNLAPYMSGKDDKSPIYRLYGVVVHLDIMNAAFSGHYVCYVKNIQGKWFKIDDSRVKPVELERVLSKGAYMLLYARCSPRPPSFIRSGMMSNGIKIRRDSFSEAIANNHCNKDTTDRARLSSAALRAGNLTSTVHRRPEDYPYRMTLDGLSSFESLNQFNRRFHQTNKIPILDSSSDSSSLFSCSDEGSCSTESTRDSTSTDDLSDYIFGESRFSWNSPWRGSDDSDVSCSSPFSRSSPSMVSNKNVSCSYERSRYPSSITEQVVEGDRFLRTQHGEGREGFQEKGNPPFLYSDTAKCCRKLTNHSSSIRSSSETNSEQLGWGNPYDMKSDVSLRRSIWGRTAQTLY